MKKYLPTTIISLILVITVGFVIFALSRPDGNESSKENKISSISEDDKKALSVGWTKGNEKADIVLTEFGDFQCPACANFVNIIKDFEKEFEGKIKIVFKQFPLTEIHKNAQLAALASEAAGEQGKFWQMHDLLYQNQNQWAESNNPIDKFVEYAKQIGIDVDKFKKDIEQKRFEQKIKDDLALGERFNLGGTPSFFVNGEAVDLKASGAEGIRQAIKNALPK